VLTHATYQALQGLWLAPWMYDVAHFDRATVAQHLLYGATAYAIGSVFFGAASDRLARRGISHLTVYKLGMVLTLAMFGLLAAGVTTGLLVTVSVYGFCSISAALAYAILTTRFAPGMAGRVNTAANLLMFLGSFLAQWGIGAVLRLYPVSDGRYAPEGYAAAFIGLGVLQLASVLWLLTMRER